MTLQRLGNHFVCPLCKDRIVAAARARKRAASAIKARPPKGPWRTVRRLSSLAFLSLAITGFIVLPAIFDPGEVSSQTKYAEQSHAKDAHSSVELQRSLG